MLKDQIQSLPYLYIDRLGEGSHLRAFNENFCLHGGNKELINNIKFVKYKVFHVLHGLLTNYD